VASGRIEKMMTIEELRHLGADMSGRIAHLYEFLGIEDLKKEFSELEEKIVPIIEKLLAE
jgi:hypothetical protein